MARKFITDRAVAFIHRVNRTLIQRVVGQEVIYYAISKENTHTHSLYNEAVQKTVATPVKINARVRWQNDRTGFGSMGADSKYGLEIYFHTQELIDRNVVAKEGDFVEYGQVFFEITSVTQPQLIYGQINNKIMTKCVCIPAREGQFQFGNDSVEDVDNSHPVEQSKYEAK
jgi:hypothetical protein